MRHAIFCGLAQAAVTLAALSTVQSASAQVLAPFRAPSSVESFAPATGIPGAVPNVAAWGLNQVQVTNGMPAGGVAGPLVDPERDVNPTPRVVPFSSGTVLMAQPLPAAPNTRQSVTERVILSKSSLSGSADRLGNAALGRLTGLSVYPAVAYRGTETILIQGPQAANGGFSGLSAAADLSGQPHCQGFALTSEGALIATGGTGYQAMILGADCETLIRAALEAGHGVIFSASVLFDDNSDAISLQAKRALEMTAIAINASTGRYDVIGYASHDGTDYINRQLALKRAKAAAYMLTLAGVNRAKLDTDGRGETSIFGPELAVNRRVVIRRKSS